MSAEQWWAPVRTVEYKIETSPEDHVVLVRRVPYFVSLTVVRFRRCGGADWSAPRVSVVGADRRGKHADKVWTLNQMDGVPPWLDRIITAATPLDPC